ncbi:MAG: MerR family transcriptional regulator [Roseburia sp.]|nr:MerR family transcriptional regulator [Roseburia sp.]
MRTVKEISDITGISVRTLHYYDEISLLKPTDKSDAGYRLYDDKALERLQQILFFREFDIPLKEIKAVMENPALDRNHILQMQRKMLMRKIERMEHLVASIDDILKGDNRMDFAVFNKTEIEEMFQAMIDHMPEEIRETAINEFGGLEQWQEHYIKTVSSEDMQKRYRKMVEWFGGKEEYLGAVKNPISKEVVKSYRERLHVVLEKLADKRGFPLDSFEVKEVVGEYGFVMKQLCQIKNEKGMMLSVAQTYLNEEVRANTDGKYGEGTAQFFMQAIEAFYK